MKPSGSLAKKKINTKDYEVLQTLGTGKRNSITLHQDLLEEFD
jgi:hypothetical protein